MKRISLDKEAVMSTSPGWLTKELQQLIERSAMPKDKVSVNNRNVAPTVFEKLKSGLGAPLTSNDMIALLNTPMSFVQQLMAGYARQIWIAKEIAEEMQTLTNLRIAEESYFNQLYAHLVMMASRVSLYEYGLTEDDINAERKAVADVIAMQEELDQLRQTLHQQNSLIITLTKERDAYINTLPHAWHHQQKTQVATMANTINSYLNKCLAECKNEKQLNTVLGDLLSSERLEKMTMAEKTFYLSNMQLTPHDEISLSRVPKAQQIMLEKPTLIPTEASLNSVMDQANNRLNIHLMRVLTGKDANQHPDEVQILKPSQVKKFDRWVNKTLNSQQPELSYWESIKQQDLTLMQSQTQKLEGYNQKIQGIQQTVDKIHQRINSIEENFESLKLTVKPLSEEAREEIAKVNKQEISINMNESSSASFFQNLELLYDSVTQMHGDKNTSQHQQAFEFRLVGLIRKLSPTEQEQFWKNCENHAKYAIGTSNKQQELFSTVLVLKEELMPQHVYNHARKG
jgi:hypothetical protein